ncbi:uncharacterized protein N7503_001261 [Penicillium pulvis]|uniref:uncharacterized protein n=1 Tax=Penicillium pulvis TaxID=1562058 RepID=UPI002547DA2D|nr:uncharacterized protein N7503_001261 [Penicillium pulvis]KAJ5809043.1 hypothetical protein N7503_001261 [Penicillium pulvis]
MGSTRASKTILLDVLANRKSIGPVHGEVQIDGRPHRHPSPHYNGARGIRVQCSPSSTERPTKI